MGNKHYILKLLGTQSRARYACLLEQPVWGRKNEVKEHWAAPKTACQGITRMVKKGERMQKGFSYHGNTPASILKGLRTDCYQLALIKTSSPALEPLF